MVFPAPFAPESRTISPVATSRSTPASAGKRPRRQTAERRRTTAGTLASGRSMPPSVRRAPARRSNPAVPTPHRRALASAPMRRVLGALGRVLVTLGSCSCSSSPTSSGAPASTRPGPRTSSSSSSTKPCERRGAADDDHARRTATGPCRGDHDDRSPPPTVPRQGDAVARIRIPKIGVDQYVVEGVDVDDLRKGPGHYPSTPLPGHEGNSAIAGHRTTYGAPFGDLDQLDTGRRDQRDHRAGHVPCTR